MMTSRAWTFETLAQADHTILERLLLSSTGPSLEALNSRVYDGYNHQMRWFARRIDTKFRKAFFTSNSKHYGLNQLVEPDGQKSTGQWRVRSKDGAPVETGYFKITPLSEHRPSQQFDQYKHLVALNYNVDPNPKGHIMRAIYDIIGMLNRDDDNLIVGRAYLCVPWIGYISAGYFVLGHPKPYGGPQT